MRACGLALSLALLLTTPLPAATDELDGPARLDGHWQLDWDRSESFEPVMEALEVSWLMRKLAGFARVRLELRAIAADCEGCSESVLVKLSTPLSSAEVRAILDGTSRPGKDPRGRDTSDRYTWTPERGLEMIREVELPSGTQARLHESRDLGSEPDTLVSVLEVWIDGAERASVRRTFRRVDRDKESSE
jgi:hypothetical protein